MVTVTRCTLSLATCQPRARRGYPLDGQIRLLLPNWSTLGQRRRRRTYRVAAVNSPNPDKHPLSRRDFLLHSFNFAILGEAAKVNEQTDATTVVNSILGAYGLPQLKAAPGFRIFDNLERGCAFEYPRAWVARRNTLREGIYISDFNTADKVVLEIWPKLADTQLVVEVIRRAVNPGNEVGGDGRLDMPPENRIKARTTDIDGQRYTYIRFPSETITRSGYQIRRKNFAVAAISKGLVYSLVASASSDQYNEAKEALLTHVVDSFRVQDS